MGQAYVCYEAQRFQRGYWIAAKEGTDRASLIKWAHSRATESEAPPMRVVEVTWASGSSVERVCVIYRSWNPQDWPTNYQLLMWWAVVRMKEKMRNTQNPFEWWEEAEATVSEGEESRSVAVRAFR